MSKSDEPTISVKLFVDKEKNRVLFAECDKDFVDVLFSFLTLPLGTIVRLLSKQSQIGCLDEVYKSVEDLSTDYFRTKACKTMLLRPLNAAGKHCTQLKIKVDGTSTRAVYMCKDRYCCYGDVAFSSVPDTVCECGKVMQYNGEWPENDGNLAASGDSTDGVFVKGGLKFIVTDDLQVAPASTSLMLSFFDKFGITYPANLEERILQLSSDKITSLLKRSLTSKQPLTGLCFDVAIASDDVHLNVLPENLHPKQENEAEQKLNDVKIRVLQTKNNSSLLYAEVGGDFVNLLLGFLSFPLGSLIQTYSQCCLNGCVDNLYKCIDGSAKGCMKPECQNLLLSPKLAPFFGLDNSVLHVEELAPQRLSSIACSGCLKTYGVRVSYCRDSNSCPIYPKKTTLYERNPKCPMGVNDTGGAYIKGRLGKFMVTNDLHVFPLSMKSTFQAINEAKIPTEKLVEKELTLTKFQVMELLIAAMMTRNAFSQVLLPPKKKLHHYRSSLY